MEKKTYYIHPNIIINNNNYHNNIAKKILKNLYKQKFNKNKKILKNELSFWSSFVNKNYILVINNYNDKDMEILRKEIELVADFELIECHILYIICKNM